jgi:hypothetical protein
MIMDDFLTALFRLVYKYRFRSGIIKDHTIAADRQINSEQILNASLIQCRIRSLAVVFPAPLQPAMMYSRF